jgi:hypothetical protein
MYEDYWEAKDITGFSSRLPSVICFSITHLPCSLQLWGYAWWACMSL